MKKTTSILSLFLVVLSGYSQPEWQSMDIPMSDEQSLAADLYMPGTCTECPVILIQTPYNKDLFHLGLPLGVGWDQESANYAFVVLDWRGRFASSDAWYSGAPNMGEDGFDAVEWIAAQDWCNGLVGTWGPSALGKVQFATESEQPPHLVCICPLVAGPQQNYSEYFPGGVLRTEYVDQLDALGFGLSPFVLGNPYYSLAWQISESVSFYPEDMAVPTLMIGGWYDHNVEVMLDFFEAIRTDSPADVQDKHRLLMGPWVHGGNSTASVGSSTQGELDYPNAAGESDIYALQFFDHYLRGVDNGWENTPYIRYYQLGNNSWEESDSWPPSGLSPVKLYLRDGGLLDDQEPVESDASADLWYDPSDPSPTIGGPTLRADLDQGPYDQVPLVESRPDILAFTTNELTEDVVLQGVPIVHLRVSNSSAPDTDMAIRLCDVYPDGRSMLVCDGIQRMRFINGFASTDESWMEPSVVYDCDVPVQNTAITFKAGHRIRLDISGSNYPRFNRNMNTGGEMYPNMNGDTLVDALATTSVIHFSVDDQSYLELPLMGFADGVEAIESKFLTTFPNPASDHLEWTEELAEVEIQDPTGRSVLKQNFIHELDVSNWPEGVYLLAGRTSTGQSVRSRFVITR